MAFDGFTGEFDKERAALLQSLAREYHEQCETYDRAVCTGGKDRDGLARPGNARELWRINRNAQLVRRGIVGRGEALGFSMQEVNAAIRKAG